MRSICLRGWLTSKPILSSSRLARAATQATRHLCRQACDAPALLTTPPPPSGCPGVSSDHGERGCRRICNACTGSGFTAATAVNFGSNDTKYFTVNSDTQITVKTPPGNGTVTITVTTPVGTSLGSAAAQFTYTSTSAEGKASQPAAPGSGFNQALRNVPRADLNRALRHCPSCQTPGTAAVINGARAVRVRTHCAAMTVVDSTLNCLSWRQPGRVMAHGWPGPVASRADEGGFGHRQTGQAQFLVESSRANMCRA